MIIVDTTIWIDYLRGTHTPHADWLEANLTIERLGLTDLILCEVLQGAATEGQFGTVREELLKLEIFETGTVQLALETALNYRRLRAAGRTVRRTIDCLIATFCLREGHTLLHNDRDYDPFEDVLGLHVLHP
ncbi:PilT protein domain protein [Nitrospira sp. KM1]|uniref:type II toxin-antitoxin system VapC family toxin n=1 Tax=Nitrospira sp. KM1 TaxID=1936990 RepID=UPI0013A774DD|nr:PIN domain nuclease [Nitrospira sp. KM1]BCA54426.1 PilT protein domain protein [Nitrospira sp. KM1]